MLPIFRGRQLGSRPRPGIDRPMALTVVSMARTLVASAVSKAASAADEASQLLGVQKEIWYVRPAILFLPHSVTPQSPPPTVDWSIRSSGIRPVRRAHVWKQFREIAMNKSREQLRIYSPPSLRYWLHPDLAWLVCIAPFLPRTYELECKLNWFPPSIHPSIRTYGLEGIA